MKIKAGDVMEEAENVKVSKRNAVKPTTDITKVLEKMRIKRIVKMPVVFGRKIVGILDFKKLVKMPDLKEAKRELRLIRRYHEKKEGICKGCGILEELTPQTRFELCAKCSTLYTTTR